MKCGESSISLSLVAVCMLVIVLIPSVLFYRYESHQRLANAYASSANGTGLYFDCWDSTDTISLEARPVTPNLVYTAIFIDFTVYTMLYTDDNHTGLSKELADDLGIFRAIFEVPEERKSKNMYIVGLFNGSNTDVTPLAQGAAMCNDGLSASDTQNLERQCLAFVNKHKEINDIKLTDKLCVPVIMK